MQEILKYLSSYRRAPKGISAEDHYEKWISQFEHRYTGAITETIEGILSNLWLEESDLISLVEKRIDDSILTKGNPQQYWGHTHILNIQSNGNSQGEMYNILTHALQRKGYPVCDEKNAKRFLYFDDMAFSYGRARNDLIKFGKNHAGADVDVLIGVTHSYSEYAFAKAISKDASLNVTCYHLHTLENRLCKKNTSDVFWLHKDALNNNECERIISTASFDVSKMRSEHKASNLFPKPQTRCVAEEAFLIYGEKILSRLDNRKIFKPYGVSTFPKSLGFGGACFSYRNCPNTTPLVFWWGTYLRGWAAVGAPTGWYPLTMRDTY